MKRRVLFGPVMASLVLAACSTTSGGGGSDPAAKRASIDANVDGAMTKLRAQIPQSSELVSRARGVLVFPAVISAGLVVGGSYGQGALRVRGKTEGYYSTTAASVGLLAGGDSKAVYILFLTDESLAKFRASNGWTAGADASVSVYKSGADIGVDTQTGQQSIVGFVLTNAGLMANLAIDGTKTSKLDL